MTRRLALVASATLAALALSPSAAGADACWQRLIHDWSADATVDGRYPVACYRRAVANLPVDLQAYSSAPTDIEAALQARVLASAPVKVRPSTEPSTGSTFRSDVLPALLFVVGVLVLLAFLALLDYVVRWNGRFEQALDTRRRT